MGTPATFLAPTEIQFVDVGLIDPAPDNIRGKDIGDVTELANSILARGLLHPLVLAPSNGRFTLIAGHRRLAALKKIGAKKAPSTVREQESNVDMVVDMIVENLQRADITPMQEARAYHRLIEYGQKQRQVAQMVGVSQPHVSKRLALVDLPDVVADAVDSGGINVNDAIQLLDLKDDPDALVRVFNNRAKGGIPFLISQVKAAQARKGAGEEEKSEDDLKAQKDAQAKRRLLSRLVKQADETRATAVKSLLKGRFVKGRSLDFTINRLIEMTPKETFELACAALGIPKVQRGEGFGDEYAAETYVAQNPEENSYRLAYAIALVRGHDPLVGARDRLEGKERLFAESTIDHLVEHGGYVPNQGEEYLVGRLEIGDIAPPPKPEKGEVEKSAQRKAKAEKKAARAAKKKDKDPNASLDHDTDERPKEGQKVETQSLPTGVGEESETGKIVCPECKGSGHDPSDPAQSCTVCEGTGWVEAGEEVEE